MPSVILSPDPGLFRQEFTLTATTTGAATVTMTRLTVNRSGVTINWGDGTAAVLPVNSTSAITHDYAGAGVWRIRVSDATAIVGLRLADAKIGGLNTSQLRNSPVTYFVVTVITGSTIRSADMGGWRPTTWRLYGMPVGTYNVTTADMVGWPMDSWYLFSMPTGTYTIASANMVNWRPTEFWLSSMPAGTYNVTTADMVGWRPAYWWMHSMPAASSSYTFAANCMFAWASATTIYCDGLALSQATVDAILLDIWNGFATRTGTAGTINVGGSNAAPSGVYQAAAACPVTGATPGKEIAHELVNDTCGVSSRHWTTVTVTA